MGHISIHAGLIVLLLLCSGVTAGESVKIVPIGDSITQGTLQNDDGLFHPTYRFWLWQTLKSKGYDVDFVGSSSQPELPYSFDRDNEGHDGFRTRDFLTSDRLKNWLTGYNPDIALVHLGSNDAMDRVPVETTISNLRQIVTILRTKNPSIVILIGTVIPRGGYGPNLPALNSAIPGIAALMSTASSPIVIVDQFTGYDGYANNQPQRYLHPNQQGEQKIADRYYTALLPYLSGERKGTTTPTGIPTTMTSVPRPAVTPQAEPESTQNPEPPTSPSPVPVTVPATIPADAVQTLAPVRDQGPAPASPALGEWCPFGGSSKQYLIGDLAFQSPVSTGWQSGSTAAGFTGFRTWEIENPDLQSSEPPAEFFIRWYPERRQGSPLC